MLVTQQCNVKLQGKNTPKEIKEKALEIRAGGDSKQNHLKPVYNMCINIYEWYICVCFAFYV